MKKSVLLIVASMLLFFGCVQINPESPNEMTSFEDTYSDKNSMTEELCSQHYGTEWDEEAGECICRNNDDCPDYYYCRFEEEYYKRFELQWNGTGVCTYMGDITKEMCDASDGGRWADCKYDCWTDQRCFAPCPRCGCGGEGGFPCPEGYKCVIDAGQSILDAGGFCVEIKD